MGDNFDPEIWCFAKPDKWCRRMKMSECEDYRTANPGNEYEIIPLDEDDPDDKPLGCPDCIAYGIISTNIKTVHQDDAVVTPMLDITRSSMIGFRDLLAKSAFGWRMLRYYYNPELGEEIQAIARNNPDISREVAEAGLMAVGFAASVLRSDGGSPVDEARVFPQELFQRLSRLGERVRSETSNPRLLEVLEDVQIEIGRFVGLTAKEALTVLQNEEAREKGKRSRATGSEMEHRAP